MPQANDDCTDPGLPRTHVPEGERAGWTLRDKPGVLVVDDDHLVRGIVQLGLERNGFDVRMAAGGREAIQLYRTHRDSIALVLLDVRMPGLDGPQTLRALREMNPEIVACFMTGAAGGYDADELLQFGAAQLIAKPFLISELVDSLRQLIRAAHADLLVTGRIDQG